LPADGSLILGTPVDLLFWLLPFVSKLASRFPVFSISELLREVAPEDGSSPPSLEAKALRKLFEVVFKQQVESACAAVCDVTGGDEAGEGEIAVPKQYRFSEKRCLKVLVAKTGRVAQLMKKRMDAALEQLKAQQSSFSAVSRPLMPQAASSSSSSSSGSSEASSAAGGSLAALEAQHWTTALEVLSEYCSNDWINKVKGAVPAVKAAEAAAAAVAASSAAATATASASAAAAAPAAKKPMHHAMAMPEDDKDEDDGDDYEGSGSAKAGAAAGEEDKPVDKAAAWNQAALEDDKFNRFTRPSSSSVATGSAASVDATSPAAPAGSAGSETSPASAGSGAAQASGVKRKLSPAAGSSAPSLAHKKLAQTNIKGMKPMTAFFGVKK
jgi:Ydr279p protein family (RNase H2 complex component) wHTH domain